jgi:hypothetical protein
MNSGADKNYCSIGWPVFSWQKGRSSFCVISQQDCVVACCRKGRAWGKWRFWLICRWPFRAQVNFLASGHVWFIPCQSPTYPWGKTRIWRWNSPHPAKWTERAHTLQLLLLTSQLGRSDWFNSYTLMPITVAARSKAWTVFARSNAGIVVSNPTRGMDVCLC